VNILQLLLLLLLHGAVQVLSQQQELLQGSHLLLLFSLLPKSDAARPIWMLWLKQKTAVDRGSRLDRSWYHAHHTRWTSPLPLFSAAPRRKLRRASSQLVT